MNKAQRSENCWYEIIVSEKKNNIYKFHKFQENCYNLLEQAEKDIDNLAILNKKRRIVKVTEYREIVSEKAPVKTLTSDEIREALKKASYIQSKEDGTQYVPFNIELESFSIPNTPTTRITYLYEDCFVDDQGFVFFKRHKCWNQDKYDAFKLFGSIF